jgi:DNA-binding transcriptional LysR family regulator
MELRHLRYFVAVADQQSFSRAAKRLHISQSAISEQIADLESELGVKLLERGSRKTELTQSGTVLLVHARRLLHEATHAIQEAQRAERGEVGTLRIGFFGGGLGDGFPQLIRSFRELYPRVELALVELSSTEQWAALLDGRIDVAFTRLPEPQYRRELRYEAVQQDAILAVLPRSHPAARTQKLDLRKLAGERFVLTSRTISPSVYDKVMELCSEAGFSPNVSSISTVWSSVILLVRSGEGVALLPQNQQQASATDLAFVPLQSKNAFVEMCVVWPAQRDRPLLRSFRELTHRHVKSNQRL